MSLLILLLTSAWADEPDPASTEPEPEPAATAAPMAPDATAAPAEEGAGAVKESRKDSASLSARAFMSWSW